MLETFAKFLQLKCLSLFSFIGIGIRVSANIYFGKNKNDSRSTMENILSRRRGISFFFFLSARSFAPALRWSRWKFPLIHWANFDISPGSIGQRRAFFVGSFQFAPFSSPLHLPSSVSLFFSPFLLFFNLLSRSFSPNVWKTQMTFVGCDSGHRDSEGNSFILETRSKNIIFHFFFFSRSSN